MQSIEHSSLSTALVEFVYGFGSSADGISLFVYLTYSPHKSILHIALDSSDGPVTDVTDAIVG